MFFNAVIYNVNDFWKVIFSVLCF